MSSVIVVDSACDLPERIINSRTVEVLPLNLILNGETLLDSFSATERLKMLHDGTVNLKQDVNTSPATRDQIVEFLTTKILPKYDFAIVQTVARSRSPQFDMWQEVNSSFAAHYREYRNSDRNFTLRIMDSGTVFTGQGLMALNTIYLGQKGVSRRELLERSKTLARNIQSYSAPVDLHYLRERARRKGDRTIGLFSATLGKALNIAPVLYGGQNTTAAVGKVKGHKNAVDKIVGHAMQAIKKGLETPLISVGYAGPLEDLKQYGSLDELKVLAKQRNVKVITSLATLTSVINMGPGTFSLAVAPTDPKFRLVIE
ncbi:MAG: DegV family protein [Cellvibrionaceae bacterium]